MARNSLNTGLRAFKKLKALMTARAVQFDINNNRLISLKP